MTANGLLQIAVFFAVIIALTKPLGGYMTRVFAGERTFLSPVFLPVEKFFYRAAGVDPEDQEQRWTEYAIAMLLFNLAGFLLLYAMGRFQSHLPFNPQGMSNIAPDLAFNTAVSFITNTNWQAYGGETTMSYLTQMAGLTLHNFVSAATGIALALAFIRGFTRNSLANAGQFLGRSDALRALYPAADCDHRGAVSGLAGRAAKYRRLYRRQRRWKAPGKPSRKGRWRRRWRSRCLAPTAVDFLTPMLPILMKIRRRPPICSR